MLKEEGGIIELRDDMVNVEEKDVDRRSEEEMSMKNKFNDWSIVY